MTIPDTPAEARAPGTWRFRAGIGVFVLAYAVWGIVPIAAFAGRYRDADGRDRGRQ